jgi:hypothetical protein
MAVAPPSTVKTTLVTTPPRTQSCLRDVSGQSEATDRLGGADPFVEEVR